tara:strand:+ start:152 stop:733 length:582 start_codon:yes stop_codon:yes gene_type:complete
MMTCYCLINQTFNLRDRVKRFATCETGAVTVDMMPLMMIAVSMGVAVTGEVANGVKGMTVGIETSLIMGVDPTADGNRQIFGALEGWGGEAIVVASNDTGSEDTTPDTETTSSDEPTSSDTGTSSSDETTSSDTDDTSSGPGNPGNDKAVGKAGETPNGDDDWGSGSNGRSDSDDTSSNSNGNSNGNGNGKNK